MPVSQAKLLGGSCSEGSGSGFAGFIEKKYPGRKAELRPQVARLAWDL